MTLMTISPSNNFSLAQSARTEMARRALAAKHLLTFCQYTDPSQAENYAAKHLRLISRYLEKAETGELWANIPGEGKKILIITTPPRHWKSSVVSRKFPAWFVGKRTLAGKPHQVILTSYAAGLAESNSRAVLETLTDNRLYLNVFPHIKISEKSRSMQEWALESEPFPTGVASGVGGGLTGHGADVLIIDDPIKDRAEANSPAQRGRLWSWWEDVARTRINPDGWCVIVMTRWHPDDIVGRLLKQAKDNPGQERIVHLRLPALAESEAERWSAGEMGLPVDKVDPLGRLPGQALWPGRVTAAELLTTRSVTPKTFDALYQGRPTPEGGFLVGREHFKTLTSAPQTHVKWVWGTDWALREREAAPLRRDEPDYSVCALVGLWTPEGNKEDARLIIGYIRRGQHNLNDARRMVKAEMKRVGPKVPVVGADNGAQIAVDHLALDGLRRDSELLHYKVKSLTIRGDKVTRAQPWLDRVHGGTVYVVDGLWNEEFFVELENFPHGGNDDQVDAVSVAVHYLGLGGGPKPVGSQKMSFYG